MSRETTRAARTPHLEVTEEGVHEQVANDEGRKDRVDQTHEDEAASQAGRRSGRKCQDELVVSAYPGRHSRGDELLLVPLAQERPPNLAVSAEQEPQQAEAKVPLQRLGQHALTEPLFPRGAFSQEASDRSLHEPGERQRDVEQVFVEEGDEVVLFSHDTVRDVVSV